MEISSQDFVKLSQLIIERHSDEITEHKFEDGLRQLG
jgi:hypothetical protein